MFDYIVIGAGIVGSTIARELSRYQVKVKVLDKENDVANVQTLANSAIIHSGHNPDPDSLKAKLCVWGNKLYEKMEEELSIPLLKSGAYVVAHNKTEEEKLAELYETAKINKVPEFYYLDSQEAKKQEPNISKNVTKVLSLPTTKVTYPWEVAFACMENAIMNGVSLQKNALVTKIIPNNEYFEIEVNGKQIFKTKNIINAAGVACDDIAGMVEKEVPYKVHGRKGEYFVLDKRVKGFVNHVLYPLPSDKGKGVLITPQFHGNILIGPTSEYVDDKFNVSTSFEGLDYVKTHAKELAENIPFNDIIRSFAGIRSSIESGDFYIEESKEFKGFYHVAGIDSPGLTSAPAIALYLLKEVIKIDKKQKINKDFNPIIRKQREFHSLSKEKQIELLKEDARYGNIICKCEKITEKEVIDAINGELGSDTIKGIKKRIRVGAGLCQGGYCEEKVMRLISREKNISPLDVKYDDKASKLFVGETKVNKL
ncbi:MAG: NAD(P)/FAD-dependent oxidoreductase [Candidatus Izimaplasma sp.]|nr:NAD(P)/FAD-dependent oxidoreductase [Candidatus Izimaplasma bacterium]